MYTIDELVKLRRQYYELSIGADNAQEKVWIKKLRNILENDIHSDPLGCKIENTHIRIGEVHLDAFFEAQILFSHTHWAKRFSEWIYEKILEEFHCEKKKILLVGFETYIEPVLSLVKEKNSDYINYCIYEEPKYIQSRKTSMLRLRYEENLDEEHTYVIYICGISSTLSTFGKMQNLVETRTDRESICLSIIQVLPNIMKDTENEYKFTLNERLRKKQNNIVIRERNEKEIIKVEYLVDVYCEWNNVCDCKKCFPDNLMDERPIIATDETSVVPIQMIERIKEEKPQDEPQKENNLPKIPKISLFEFDSKGYKYERFLYYGHLERDDHHYNYYIRTAKLFQYIYKEGYKQFKKFCDEIKDRLSINVKKSEDESEVYVIVAPSHYSNQFFPIAINKEVFNNTAHIISFDIKKEYRSNFETKFSNFAYFFKQIEDAGNKIKIRFFFVDDQIISGDTYYRAKSLINSLIGKDKKFVDIFSGIIVLLNRSSQKTISDYFDKKENLLDNETKDDLNYFALIDINIPSIRNYGDSCPLCKLELDATNYSQLSLLDCSERYWIQKQYHYKLNTLEDARAKNADKGLRERRFRRFDCENTMWEEFRGCQSEDNFIKGIIEGINNYKKSDNYVNFEYLISAIKAISRPFLYYKENEKKAVLYFLLNLISHIIKDNGSSKLTFSIAEGRIKINFNNREKNKNKYVLVETLVNSLASIDSNYVLHFDTILRLCEFVEKIGFYNKLNFVLDNNEQGFYNVILNAVKRVLCGISGEAKAKFFEEEYNNKYFTADGITNDYVKYEILFNTLYLENANANDCAGILENKDGADLIGEYSNIAENIKSDINEKFKLDDIELIFYYYDNGLSKDNIFSITRETRIKKITDLLGIDEENEKKLNTIGYLIKENEILIKLHHYSMESIKKNKDGNKLNNGVYLYIKSKEKLSIHKKLELLRLVLTYRYGLSKKIYEDLSSGTIKTAIQAEKAAEIFISEKFLSHGKSYDIADMYENIINQSIRIFSKSKDEVSENDRFDLYTEIKVLMNRTISSVVNTQLYNTFFKQNGDKYSVKEWTHPIVPKVSKSKKKEINYLAQSMLSAYIDDIMRTDSGYIINIVSRYRREAKEKSKVTNLPNESRVSIQNEADELKNVVFFPNLLSNLGNKTILEYETNSIWLIGFIDLFVRNVIKHNIDKNNINMKISYKEIDERSYSVTISNKIDSMQETNGMTKTFCDILNHLMDNEEKNVNSGFTHIEGIETMISKIMVNMGPDIDDKSVFQATIIIKF